MHAESEAQMQHFANSVYGQNDTTEASDQMSELARIESRSVNFARWKSGVEDSGQVPEIPERLLRHWVDADIASFRRLEDEIDVEIAADNIYSNYQLYDAYCKEMQQLAGDVARRVDELNAASRKRGEEQDRVSAKDLVARMRDTESQRQLPENEDLVDGFASGGPGPDMKPADPALVARILESITYKGQADGSVLYLLHERPAFIDHGRQILLDKQALEDDQAILAAVLLAKEKYGGAFSLTGSEQFKRRALEVIAKHNVPIKLKSPAQEMMLIEIGASYPEFSNMPKLPAARDLLASSDDSAVPVADATNPLEIDQSAEPQAADPNASDETLPAEGGRILRAVSANDWWSSQVDIIKGNFSSPETRLQLLDELGRAPSAGTVHWFDQAGNHVRNPDVDEIRAYEGRSASSARDVQALSLEDRLAVAKATQQQYILSGDLDTAAVHASEELEPLQEQWNELHQVPLQEISGCRAAIEELASSDDSIQRAGDAARMARRHLLAFTDYEGTSYESAMADVIALGMELDERYSATIEQECPTQFEGVIREAQKMRLSGDLDEAPASCIDLQLSTSEVKNVFSNSKRNEEAMSEQESKSPVLRGIARNPDTGDFETTVLLFKGKGDYLQGFIMQDGNKHQVLAHINERKADEGTGEIKPNFLKLSKAEGQGDDVQWTELGFGNAVNKRADDKPVFHDEVLFNVNGKTISARLGKDVSEELHAKLGFTSARVERPKNESKEGQEVPKTPAPEQKVAAEKPVAQASAPEPRKPRKAAGARP